MVTNWCVGFLILIYKKEDSALPINSILSKVHVNDNAHCFAAAKIEQFFFPSWSFIKPPENDSKGCQPRQLPYFQDLEYDSSPSYLISIGIRFVCSSNSIG